MARHGESEPVWPSGKGKAAFRLAAATQKREIAEVRFRFGLNLFFPEKLLSVDTVS